MNLSAAKPNTAIIDFINDQEVVVIGKDIYPVSYNLKPFEEILYSLPDNHKHSPYTAKHNVVLSETSKEHLLVINKAWSPFKKGDEVRGSIKDGTFYIIR